jgi:hypothetical protein
MPNSHKYENEPYGYLYHKYLFIISCIYIWNMYSHKNRCIYVHVNPHAQYRYSFININVNVYTNTHIYTHTFSHTHTILFWAPTNDVCKYLTIFIKRYTQHRYTSIWMQLYTQIHTFIHIRFHICLPSYSEPPLTVCTSI